MNNKTLTNSNSYIVYSDLINNISNLLTIAKINSNEGLCLDELEYNLLKSLTLPNPIKKEIILIAITLFSRGDYDLEYLISCCESIRKELDDSMSKNFPYNSGVPLPKSTSTIEEVKGIVNVKQSSSFKVSKSWLGKEYTVSFNQGRVNYTYDHDLLFEKLKSMLNDSRRKNSWDNYGYYTSNVIPNWVLETPGAFELIKVA